MTSIKARRRRLGRLRASFLLWSALVAASIAATAAQATTAAAPQSNSPPTISGQAREGRTVTALNGNWGNSPTSFSYQWQQCDASGANCNSIVGATSKTYTVVAGDVDHQLRVAVTATNADGSASATSQPSGVVSSRSGPTNTASPTISGTAKVGEELQAQNGTWTGGVKSYAYQWQRCDKNGASCQSVDGATGRVYGVRSADAGNTLRVVVTATNLSGSTNATSAADRPRRRHHASSGRRAQPRADDQVRRPEAARRPHLRAVLALRRLGEGRHRDRARLDAGQARLRPALLGRAAARAARMRATGS